MPHECTSCRRVFPDGSKEMLSGCPDCGGNKFQFRPSGTVPDDGAGSGAEREAAAGEPPEPPEPQSPGGGVAETVAGATERVRSLVGSDDDAADGHEWPAVGREDGPRSAGEDDGAIRAETAGSEDTAQASARSGVVDPDELPDHTASPAVEDDAQAAGDAAATDGAGAEAAGSDASAPTSPGAPPSPGTDPSGPSPAPDAGGSADAGAGADAGSDPRGDPADGPDSAPFTGSGDRDDSPDLAELREELNDQFESIKIVDRGQYELNLMELYDREEYIISLLEDGRYAIEVPETWRDD